MPSGFPSWSQTAASNANADSTINWAEGQAPSSVNDSARAMMAALAKYRDDNGSNLTTGGTSTAYTLTTNQGFVNTTLMNGQELSFQVHTTNGPNATITIDGVATAIIVGRDGLGNQVIPAGTLVGGNVYSGTYYSSVNEFRMKGFFASPYTVPIGGMMDFIGSSVPNANFVFPIGQAISRTTYATLFSLIGTTYGTGDGSTTFNVPDLTGRVTAMKEASATRLTSTYFGGNSTTLGATGGLESHTLTTAQLAAHSHGVTDPGHTHTYLQATGTQNQSGSATAVFVSNSSQNTGSSTTGISIQNAGSGNAHNNVQPTMIVNKILRII